MDRILQRLAIVLCFTTSLVFGQCKEIRVGTDTVQTRTGVSVCKVVIMSPDKFAYYYLAEKNLSAIEDSIPRLATSIERERSISDSVERNLQQQVDLVSNQSTVLLHSYASSEEELLQTRLAMIKLTKKLNRQKVITKAVLGGGFVGGTIFGIFIRGLWN